MKKQRLLSIALFVLMIFNLFSPTVLAKNTSKQVVARPLVVMMEYQDYKFSDIDTKEDWRLRGISGDEYTKEFVQEMLFGKDSYIGEEGQQFITTRSYYEEITGGNYSLNGKVVGPYTAKENATYYGSDRNQNGTDQDEAMLLVREAIQAVAKDSTIDLSDFDVEDRTGTGEFGKSDGVIDTIIVVHPGVGEEWGGGSLKEGAIWPFRIGFSWYTQTNLQMEKVTDHKGKEWLFDDFVLISQDSASDMLIHEYGHILGLSDLYGASGSNPPVKWWDIMGGSYTGKDIAGTMPISYGAYSREFLQKSFENRNVQNPKWANYQKQDFLNIDKNGLDLELHQAHERVDGKTDLFRLDLPRKETIITKPTSGQYAYFSGNDNNSRNYMKTTVDLTDYEKVKLEFRAWYKIDPYFDFATVRVNKVESEEFETLEGNITTTKFDDWILENETEEERLERNPGHGITDDSKGWVDAKFDLSKYAGEKIELNIYFWSDTNTPEEGIYIDDILIEGVEKTSDSKSSKDSKEKWITILKDDVEGKLEFDIIGGFTKSTGIKESNHYYLLEWRNSEEGKVDEGLRYVYYMWSDISYDPGLLIWYINEMWIDSWGKPDQQVKEHPGECFAGIVDADQNPVGYDHKDGKYYDDPRVDFNMHDAAFSLRKENYFYNDWGGSTVTKDLNSFMVPEFDDSKDYTNPVNDQAGLILPEYGIKILVTEENNDRSSSKIHILNSNLQNKPVNYSDGLNVKNIAIKDDTIEIKAENKGKDKDLGEKAYISYVKKGDKNKSIEIKEELLLEDGVYKCSTDFLENADKGTYQINFIILEDEAENTRAIYNSKVHSGYGMNLSSGDIHIKK